MQKNHRPTLYLIGGMARVGKSHVARAVIHRKRIATARTDIIRAAIRKAFTGESYIAIHDGYLRGAITFHRPGSLKEHRLTITRKHWDENEMIWQGALGFIETYDRHKENLLIEGVAITPERVHGLRLKNLRVRAVFLGYENESQIEAILAHSRKKNDWIQRVIEEHGGDEAPARRGLRKGIAKSVRLRRQAKRFGYGYFDVSAGSFRTQIKRATSYLLKGGR